MKLKTNKLKEMKLIFSAISDMNDEVKLSFSDKFMEFEAMDKSNTTYCRLKVVSTFFDEYEPELDGICFKTKDLKEYLNMPREGDSIILSITEDKSTLMMEVLGNINQFFTMPLLAGLESQDIPKNYPSIVAVKESKYTLWTHSVKPDTDKLIMAVKNLNKMGTAPVTFKIKDKKFSLLKIEELKKGEIFFGIYELPDMSASFNSSFIEKFCTLAPISESVEIHMKDNYPILFNLFKLNSFQISYMTAPLVDLNS